MNQGRRVLRWWLQLLGVALLSQLLVQLWLLPVLGAWPWEQRLWMELAARALPMLAFAVWRVLQWMQRHPERRRLTALSLACLGLGLGLVFVLLRVQLDTDLAYARARFDRQTELIEQDLERRFAEPVQGLKALSARYAAEGAMPRDAFRRYVEAMNIEVEYPGVHGFGRIDAVPRQDAEAFQGDVRANGESSFSIRSRREHEPMLVVRQLEPGAGTGLLTGWDVMDDPAARLGAESAIALNQAALSGLMDLAHEGRSSPGFYLFMPLFRPGEPLITEPQRRSATAGLLFAQVMAHELLQGLSASSQHLLALRLHVVGDTERSVFELNASGSEQKDALFRATRALRLAALDMELHIASTEAFNAAVMDPSRYVQLGLAGALVCLLGSSLVLALARGRAEAVALADAMTQELREKSQRLDLALEGGTDGLWDRLDTHGEAEWWSPQFYRLLGLEPGEITASVVEFDRRLHPDDQTRTMAALAASLEGGAPYDVEYRLRTQDGSYRWFRSRAKVFRDDRQQHQRIAGSLQDIHELKLSQAVLREQSERLAAIFTLSPDGFAALDDAHTIAYLSPRFAELCGMSSASLLGQSVNVWLAALAEREQTAGVDAEAAASWRFDTLANGPLQLHLQQPQRRVLELSLHRSGTHALPGMLQLRDVSQQFEVDRLKREFLSSAAHELRTPMVTLFGYAELLVQREMPPDRLKQYLGRIHQQSQTMMALTTQLLELARLEASHGADFEFEPIALAELVDQFIEAYQPPDGRAPPFWQLPPDTRCLIRGDRLRLQQVLSQLLANAYKYSPEGGDVSLRLARDDADERWCLSITDQGMGMSAEQVARAPERFYRADASGHRLGAGLGLSIAKDIIELHGAELNIASSPGAGTTVSLRFRPATSGAATDATRA